VDGRSTVEDRRPRNSYHRVCCVFVAQAASACRCTPDVLIILCFSLILDNERWKQADVPAEFQDLVDHIGNNGRCSLGFVCFFSQILVQH